MFINMDKKDIPYWDSRKFFWQQTKSAIQFFQNEYNKILNGINLGGYYMSGWMYFHINFFQTTIIDPNTLRKSIKTPPLDDNTYYLMECYKEAVKQGLGLCMWGTRGFAKSTFIGSIKHWTHLTKDGTSMLVYKEGNDLSSIRDMITTSMSNIHPAFKLNILRGSGDWKDTDVVFGNSTSHNEEFIKSQLRVINANGGAESASEKGAGLTPIGYVMDEIGKFNPTGIFEAAKASFKYQNKSLFTYILAGTGGNESLSEGAKKMLLSPKDYDLLIMNWDLLNNMVPEEHITWKEDVGRKFGIFVPGQMSYRENEPKLEKTFGEFTKNKYESEELNSMNINVTDWKATKEKFQEKLDSSSDETVKTNQRMYYPMCIDDSFLTSKVNPFDSEAITRKLRQLKEKPKHTLVDFEIDPKTNKITTTFQSDKPLAERGYKKAISAPYMIFDNFPKEVPPKFTFVSGADDYKSADATTESLGSIYVLERRTINMPLEKIAACLVERPITHREMHSKWEKLIRGTQAICNLEAADTAFVSYLEDVIKVDAYQYLHPFINPHAALANKKKGKVASNYRFGTYPHQWNVKILLDTVIDYTQQTFTVGFDTETNAQIINCGIDLIDDPMLLQEMLDFKYGSGNYDRLFSFGWALVLARYLDSKNIMPEDKHVEKYNNEMSNRQMKRHSNFGKSSARNF